MSILELRGVCRFFGGVKALQDIDLCIEPGTINAVIGPNGAGKSTLFNVVSGVDRLDKGDILFYGVALQGLPAWQINRLGLARTFQNIRLFQEMTVAENILVGCHAYHYSSNRCLEGLRSIFRRRREDGILWEKVRQQLDFFGLVRWQDELAGQIPYGKQRELEMARALVGQPKLLLLDEPAAGMNPQETEQLMAAIGRIKDLGVTVVLVEHDMKLVMKISRKIFVLNFGKKIAEGSPAAIRQHPEVVKAYLGEE